MQSPMLEEYWKIVGRRDRSYRPEIMSAMIQIVSTYLKREEDLGERGQSNHESAHDHRGAVMCSIVAIALNQPPKILI